MHHNTDEMSDLRLGLLLCGGVAFVFFSWFAAITAGWPS